MDEKVVVSGSDVAVAEPEQREPVTTEGEAAPEGEEKPEGEKKPEPSAEEKETARERHNRRQWERLTRERAEFKAKAEMLEKFHAQQNQPQAANNGRPSRADFDNDEDYVDALTDYKLKQHLEPIQGRLAEQARRQVVEVEWQTKVSAAEKAYPDFKDVLESAVDVQMTPEMMEAIKTSDLGADLAYYLAKNQDDAIRIANMPAIAAARELGRIESYLEYEKTQNRKKASAAPPPARLPNGSSTRSGSKSLAEMSYDDYVKARNAMKKR